MYKSSLQVGDLVTVEYDRFMWPAIVVDTLCGEPNSNFDQDYCVVLTIPDDIAAFCYSYVVGGYPLYAKFNVCLIKKKVCEI